MQDRFNVELNKECATHGKVDFIGIADGYGVHGETIALFVITNLNSVVQTAFHRNQNMVTVSRTSQRSKAKDKDERARRRTAFHLSKNMGTETGSHRTSLNSNAKDKRARIRRQMKSERQKKSLVSNITSSLKSFKDKIFGKSSKPTRLYIGKSSKFGGTKQVMGAIQEGCLNLDEKLRDAAFQLDTTGQIFNNGGATFCGVWVRENKTYCCNVGHCRIVMSYRGKAIAVTEDHLVTKREEKERIVGAGGLIANNRINGILNMSRSFGIFSFKNNAFCKRLEQCVTAEPDIYMVETSYDIDFLVLASTGIWEILSNQEVVDFVFKQLKQGVPLKKIASNLIKLCEHQRYYARGSMHNPGAVCLPNLTCAIVIVKTQKPCLVKLMKRAMPVNLIKKYEV